jgi:Fe2+ or Zn2+ uptake regulation protein
MTPRAAGLRDQADGRDTARGRWPPADTDDVRRWAHELLRQVGLPVTQPRMLVLAALRARARPVTAQDLHAELAALPRPGREDRVPGLTTIYRALAALADRGVLHCFHHNGGTVTAYRLCRPINHHHLVCRCCGQVQEMPPGPMWQWANHLAAREGFAVEDYRAELTGLCAACRPESTQPHPQGGLWKPSANDVTIRPPSPAAGPEGDGAAPRLGR